MSNTNQNPAPVTLGIAKLLALALPTLATVSEEDLYQISAGCYAAIEMEAGLVTASVVQTNPKQS